MKLFQKVTLFIGAAALSLVAQVHAASTVTVSVETSTETIAPALDAIMADFASFAAALQPKVEVPVEQKVVEINMSSKPTKVVPDAKKKKNKGGFVEKLPLGAGTCSGSFVSDSGDVLTARHCVEGFDTFEVLTFDHRVYEAVVVATSPVHDLALLHIDRRNTPHFDLAESAVRGQKIFVLGSPLGITDTLATGVIARLEGDTTLLDCSVLPGNSGGPVFNERQELVGVVIAGYIVMAGMTHLNIAQGTDSVHFFLKKALEHRDVSR